MKNMSSYINTNPATTDTPNGTFKNETQPNAGDGTDIKAEHMQDLFYALFQILQLAGEVPNGELENGKASKQFIRCLTHIGWFKYDSTITYKKNAIVINTVNNITRLYRSQIDNNTNALIETASWVNILSVNADNTITLNSTSVDNNGVFIGAFMYGIRNDTPEGWLRCDGSEYSASIFSGFVNNHLLTGKVSYKTLTEWQTEYNNNNGNCGYFAYDEENDILKVPCIKDNAFISQALNSGNISSFVEAGLPNITGSIQNIGVADPVISGAISYTNIGSSTSIAGTGHINANVSIDASKSNSIYGNSDTVTPLNIMYPLFICVSNAPVPTTEVEYNEFINALNNKANISGSNVILDNLPATAKENISTLSFPGSSYDDLTLNASGSSYTAPADGYYHIEKNQTGNQYVLFNNSIGMTHITAPSSTNGCHMNYPVKKGEVIKIHYTATGTTVSFKFVYANNL